jgi:transcriptional regulator with XRE-family HTH domain
MEPEPQDPLRELSPAQELALEALLAGKTQVEAAEAAGVARETVNRWYKRHPGFIAAYRQRRQARAAAAEEVAANLDRQAMEVVADAVGEGDTKAAIAWLRVRPKSQPEPSNEATTAEGVFEEMAKAEDTRLIANALSLRGYAASRGIDVPSSDVVRRLLEDDLRREHGLAPLPVEVPHWSERDRVPCSWLVYGAEEMSAAERLRNYLNTGDGSHITDVAPIGAEDIRELAEILEVQFARHLPMPEHPCEGDRFRLIEIDSAMVASIARVANLQFDDLVATWWESGLSEDPSPFELAAILGATVATAARIPAGERLYLGKAHRVRKTAPPTEDDSSEAA